MAVPWGGVWTGSNLGFNSRVPEVVSRFRVRGLGREM